MARVFISYARKDASTLAHRLARDLAAGHKPWLDRDRIEGGAQWAQAIEQAIDRTDALLALLSDGSFESRICRAEHMRALRKGKRVIPLLVSTNADRPLYLEGDNYIDFTPANDYPASLAQLIEAIGKGGQMNLDDRYRQTYVNAPPLPPHFVERLDEALELRRHLLTDDASEDLRVTALTGMEGIGKSTLALAICHDPIVQDAFPDGVIWIDVGSSRRGEALTECLAQLGAALGDGMDNYTALSVARTKVRSLLERRAVLIVLDDVWSAEQVQAFRIASAGCRILVNTGDESVAALLGAPKLRLGPLSAQQSLDLLAGWAGFDSPMHGQITRRAGRHPLALKLAGIHLAEGTQPEEWLDSFSRVARMRLGRRASGRSDSVRGCLDVSVSALASEDRGSFDALGIFPADLPIPAAVCARLWRTTQDWKDIDARDFARDLVRLGLAEPADAGAIRLHRLICGYVAENLGDKLAGLQRAFLESYAASGEDWRTVPDDGYIHYNIAHHMAGARQLETLRWLCLDLGWLQTKLRLTGIPGIVADLASLPADESLTTLHAALRLASAVVTLRPQELRTQLIARTDPASGLGQHIRQAECGDDSWLQPVHCEVRGAGSAGLCAFDATSGHVASLAIAPDGKRVLAGHKPGLIDVWDVASGSLAHELAANGETVWDVAFSADGLRFITACESGQIDMRDAASGEMLRTLQAGDAALRIALSSDGRFLAAGTRSGMVRLWDLKDNSSRDLPPGDAIGVRGIGLLTFAESGSWLLISGGGAPLRAWQVAKSFEPRLICGYHMFVGSIPVSVRGTRALYAFTPWRAAHGLIEVVDLDSETLVQRFESADITTRAVVLSPDGRRCAVATGKTIRLHDIEHGMLLHELRGHRSDVHHLRWPTEDMLLSADQIRSVIAWDPDSATARGIFSHPTGYVGHLAVTADGARAASSTWVGDIRVWRLRGDPGTFRHSHASAVQCVDIDEQGSRAVSGDADGHLLFWDIGQDSSPRSLEGHKDSIDSVQFSADGTHILTASCDGTMRIWDSASLRSVAELPWPATRGSEARWCPDGAHVAAVAGDGFLAIWSLREGREVFHYDGGEKSVWSFGPDRFPTHVVVAWHDGRLRSYALPTGKLLGKTDIGTRCYFAAAAASAKRAVVKCEDGPSEWFGRLRVWDLETLQDCASPTEKFESATLLQALGDAEVLCAGDDGTLRCCDLEAGTVRFDVRHHDRPIRGLSVTRDRRRAATAGWDGQLLVWNLDCGDVLAGYTADEPLMAVAASSAARTIIAGDRSGGIHVLRLRQDEAS